MQQDPSSILERIRKDGIEFLQFQFTDILGVIKTVTVPKNRFEATVSEGVVFDGSSVAGYAQIEESDMRAIPDYSTYTILPDSGGKVARFICDVYTPEGKRFEGDPRYVLQKTVQRLKKDKLDFFVGPEFEFFIFKLDENGSPTNKPSDYGGYFDNTPLDAANEIRQEILDSLYKLGYQPEAAHHEVAYGQHEIDLKYAEAVVMADRVAMLKSIIKNTARAHGLYATFMPKPINGVNGSGMHVHQSIMTEDEKQNMFWDERAKYGISEMGMHYLAGILANINQGAAVLASWVNSYKRLIPGFEAPVYISWANKNRTALVRIPAGTGMKKRMELRCPDPAGNPYLQFAVILGMGLDGIQRKLEPPEPVERDIFHMTPEERQQLGIQAMPESLGEALHHLKNSKLMREILGQHVFENFIEVKTREWDAFRSHVTQWELERYLPRL
ncbi:glutamine synthetase [Thermogymnomonas acidicola]|uniref:Glutamine synthetase n=1 Tax=Thermogymnomonas acidicola TaxID=399579 RepID=A0AA37F8X8_9ARCH|nr:type I glutamate--ammonia ligase [Thermogymnomonas acidicola]GGM69296.1 glutamine synthetase [Thermogymnomonas acidicola]